MSCTSSFFGTTASLSFGGFGSGGTAFNPPSAWNFAMRVLLYDQPSENFFILFFIYVKKFIMGARRERLNLGKPAGTSREEAYGHDDFCIGIAAVYSGHSSRWGKGRRERLSAIHSNTAYPPHSLLIQHGAYGTKSQNFPTNTSSQRPTFSRTVNRRANQNPARQLRALFRYL